MNYFKQVLATTMMAILPLSVTFLAQDALGAEQTVRTYNKQAEYHPLGEHHDSVKPLDIVKGSKANLTIMKDGAYICVETRNLKPGNVVTAWVGIYNKPENCKAKPCDLKDFLDRADETVVDMGYADGLIVGPDGTGKFSAFIPRGALRQNWFGNGVQNLASGEFHVVIHEHGLPVPGLTASMLSTYRGGCKTESLFKKFPEISLSDGKPGPNDCNIAQVIRFVQEP